MINNIKRMAKRYRTLHNAALYARKLIARTKDLVPYSLRTYKDMAFHGDLILRSFVTELLASSRFTSFVETGTHKATTTIFVANANHQLPIYTCEIDEKYFNESSFRLKHYSNIRLSQKSSPLFLEEIISTEDPSRKDSKMHFPLVFLDAHWQDYYPLLAEMKMVRRFPRAVIIIDDVRVPDRDDFNFILFNEEGVKKDLSIEYIRSALTPTNTYRVFFPTYTRHDAYGKNPHDNTFQGYAVIFQNLSKEEFKMFSEQRVLSSYYKEFRLNR